MTGYEHVGHLAGYEHVTHTFGGVRTLWTLSFIYIDEGPKYKMKELRFSEILHAFYMKNILVHLLILIYWYV